MELPVSYGRCILFDYIVLEVRASDGGTGLAAEAGETGWVRKQENRSGCGSRRTGLAAEAGETGRSGGRRRAAGLPVEETLEKTEAVWKKSGNPGVPVDKRGTARQRGENRRGNSQNLLDSIRIQWYLVPVRNILDIIYRALALCRYVAYLCKG